jgi:hypothetical protein
MPFPIGTDEEIARRIQCWKAFSPYFITLRPSQYFNGFSFFGTVASWTPDQAYYIPSIHMVQSCDDGGVPGEGYVIATLGRQEADGDVLGGLDPAPAGGPIASIMTAISSSNGAAQTSQFFDFNPYGLYVDKGDTLLVSVLANGSAGDCNWLLDCRFTLIPTFG